MLPPPISNRNLGNESWFSMMKVGAGPPFNPSHYWLKKIDVADLVLPAALTEQYDLNDILNDPFPPNVRRTEYCLIGVEVPLAGTGITSVTADLGVFGGAVDSLVDNVTVSGGVARWESTPGGAGMVLPYGQVHAALAPGLTLTSVGANLDQLTDGVLWMAIPRAPLPGAFTLP